MEALKNFKLISLFLGGLLGGFGFLFVGLKSPKAIGDLKTFENPISDIWEEENKISSHEVIRFTGRNGNYKFMGWSPHQDLIDDEVAIGETIKVWSDVGDNYWIWKIEKNSQVLLSYDEFLSSMKTNKYGGIAASIFAFIVSGVAAWALVKQTTS